MPEFLRKTLGEFYTPDWLVDFTLDRAKVDDWLRVRTLDPTCGSGSFLTEVIRRKREAARRAELSADETLTMLTQSVWGYDLNPLAVQTARTNFLMAVADLLGHVPGRDIEIPVLLADAVYSPSTSSASMRDVVEYEIGSYLANLKVVLPQELARDRPTLDKVFDVMEESVGLNAGYTECREALMERDVVRSEQLDVWDHSLSATYLQVLSLHRRNWNGIWFRIIRNFFWSAASGRFDLVVGNPPWVRWSKLPEAYRNRAKPTCEQYDIFSDTPHHGGNELDISGMITYTTADKWLRKGGTLAFVITQTHFQSPSSQGFRRFRIDTVYRLAPMSVDDMKSLRPFRGAANKTSVVVFRKGTDEPQYPVRYRMWRRRAGFSSVVPPHLSLAEVENRVDREVYEAHPVGAPDSPWAILRPGRFEAVAAIRGTSEWAHGRKGITADLNGVYFVTVDKSSAATGLVRVTSRPTAGRTDIGDARSFWVEPDLLYPLIKGASDFTCCHVQPKKELYAFVPNRGITIGATRDADRQMTRHYPRTREYFKAYEPWLRKRSTWKKQNVKNAILRDIQRWQVHILTI